MFHLKLGTYASLVSATILLGAVAFLSLLLAEGALGEDWGRSFIGAVAALAVTFFVLTGILLGLTLIGAGLRWIVNFALNALTQSVNRRVIIVATAVTVVLFPSLVAWFFEFLVALAHQFFVVFPNILIEPATKTHDCISHASSPTECFALVYSEAATSITRTARGILFDTNLRQFSLGDAFLAAAVWTLCIGLATSFWAEGRLLDRLDFSMRRVLLMASLGVVAAFLALNSILAISMLETAKKVDQIAPAKLAESLLAMQPPAKEERSGESIDILPAKATPTQPSFFRTLLTADKTDPNWEIDAAMDEYRRLTKSANTMVAAFNRERQTVMQRAIHEYALEDATRIGAREQSFHFKGLLAWYSNYMRQLDNRIRSCGSGLESIPLRISAVVTSTQALASGADKQISLAFSRAESDNQRRQLRLAIQSARDACEAPLPDLPPAPDRLGFGSFLGPIGAVAQWLLATESRQISLIVGLIGFGMLGALVARFVHSAGADAAPTAEVIAVVFKGFVAAIIVYVASYGGIALAGGQEGDPNPYGVFGLCLAGAVFSDRIWARARDIIDPQGPGAAPAGQPDGPPPRPEPQTEPQTEQDEPPADAGPANADIAAPDTAAPQTGADGIPLTVVDARAAATAGARESDASANTASVADETPAAMVPSRTGDGAGGEEAEPGAPPAADAAGGPKSGNFPQDDRGR